MQWVGATTQPTVLELQECLDHINEVLVVFVDVAGMSEPYQ